MMRNKASLITMPLLVSAGALHGQMSTPAGSATLQRPNVLFIIADDLATRLGCYGDSAAITTNLDKLASEGVLFERAYAAGTICTPSRKSFLTGLSVATVGHRNENYLKDHPEAMTLPRWFRENGYQTAKVGKVQHTDAYEGPLDWDLNLNLTEKIPGGNVGKIRTILYSEDDPPKEIGTVDVRQDDQETIDEGRTDVFKKFIGSMRDPSKPFFFALGCHAPHGPHEANLRHYQMHPLERMPLTIAPEGATPMVKSLNFKGFFQELPDDTQRLAIQGYYAAVSGLDEQIGRALKFLEEQGLAGNTIVVFTSDQGYCLGYRNTWAKHIVYPPVLQVPLIVRYPGMPNAGSRTQGLVELLDIFPSLCELSGIPIPDGLDGTSFVPLVKNPAGEGKAAVYAQGILSGEPVVTTRDWTYMEWDKGTLKEFYNISKDTKAWFNLSANPENQQEMKRHKELLRMEFGQKK
jgi:arylsulfatase A-like enzyme